MRIQLRMLIATIAFIASATGAAANTATTVAPIGSAQSSQTAVWIPQRLHIVFPHPDAFYSCDLFAEEIKLVLVQLGARPDDLNVDVMACYSHEPKLTQTFDASFAVLTPADAAAKTAGGSFVDARWQTVHIGFDKRPPDESFALKLANQGMPPNYRLMVLQLVRQQILPSFTSQGVKISKDGRLRVQVLKPLQH
jgi:hypothetical protein